MQLDLSAPRILPPFDALPKEHEESSLYLEMIKRKLREVMPPKFWQINLFDQETQEDLREELLESLPFFFHSPFKDPPFELSFFYLAKERVNSFKFFFEMVSGWILPGKRLEVLLVYAADFKLPDFSSDSFTFCEVKLRILNQNDLLEIKRNLSNITTEIRLGLESSYYARRILEIRGLGIDEKTVMIQEHIAYLLKRLPKALNHDVFSEMQHVLVICRETFKNQRSVQHLSRIIAVRFLLHQALKSALMESPDKRHLFIKLFSATLQKEETLKKVLAIVISLNFLDDKEVFEERHILKAIHNYIPDIQVSQGSFFSTKSEEGSIGTIYLEIEKRGGQEFSFQEVKRLKEDLAGDLKDRIEHLMHPIFMPRNEEEIMRNILILSEQIKYLRDSSQVFITFDEQTHTFLYFTVILVRLLKSESLSLHEILQNGKTYIEYQVDFVKNIGYVRKKPKESSVFRAKLPKEIFLRADHSIDLYKARQAVFEELEEKFRGLRDYNGGMISKQNELLCSVRELLAESGTYSDILLENFFYSLNPPFMRTSLEAQVLKTLFVMMLDGLDASKNSKQLLTFKRDLEAIFVMIISDNAQIKESIDTTIQDLNFSLNEFVSVFVLANEVSCLGYIYFCDDPYKQEHFSHLIRDKCENFAECGVVA